MKSVYCVLVSMSVILVFNQVKSEQLNDGHKNVDEINDQQLSKEEIRARLLSLLVGDASPDSSSNEQDEYDNGIDKRMTYRYGKRMTYRYGKRSAMPYRFGKRSNDDDLLEEILRNHKFEEPKHKRMTYRYGRSVDNQ